MADIKNSYVILPVIYFSGAVNLQEGHTNFMWFYRFYELYRLYGAHTNFMWFYGFYRFYWFYLFFGFYRLDGVFMGYIQILCGFMDFIALLWGTFNVLHCRLNFHFLLLFDMSAKSPRRSIYTRNFTKICPIARKKN
mgnify:CR=1 FL=1